MTKAEKTRAFIIEHAAPIINKKGMAGTAISDIMEATKLAKGGIYGNFEGKDEICLEAFNYLNGSLSNAIEKSMGNKKTAREKLFAILNLYKGDLASKDSGGCPILNFGTEADDTSPVIKEQVKKAILNSLSLFTDILKEGIASNEFNATIDAGLFALKMFSMIEGGILANRVTGSLDHLNRLTDMLKAEIEQFTN